jgi:hypothetical protein
LATHFRSDPGGASYRRESEKSGPPGGRAEVGHDHSLLVPFDRDAPRGAVPIERVSVGVPAEQIARAEEKIAGVHCFGTDAHQATTGSSRCPRDSSMDDDPSSRSQFE